MSKNPRISKREYGLIKGALRRAFSRSEIRAEALKASVIPGFSDPKRPRVSKWSRCPSCDKLMPTYLMEVDHIEPVIPITIAFEDMTLDNVVERLWCDPKNLVAICEECHKQKSKKEAAERAAERKKRRQNGKKRRKVHDGVRSGRKSTSDLRHGRRAKRGYS
jgi:5-methylcytosine-specific restriction endonuclease McrA